MSSTDSVALRPPPEPILPPYSPTPGWLGRLIIYLGVVLFCLIWGSAFALLAPFAILAFFTPWVILGVLIFWALPDARTAPLRSLSIMVFVFIGTLVLWPNYIALALPGLPWITMNRLSGVPFIFILLICASTSADFRRKSAAALRATPLILRFFLGFLLLQAISILFSASKVLSLNQFISSQINLTGLFFASIFVFQRPGLIERMAKLLWIMAIICGVIAIFEFRVKHALWFGHIPSFLQINDPAVLMMLSSGTRGGLYRSTSTFGNALTFGEYLSLVMPFVANFMIGPYGVVTRVAAAISIPFICFVVVLSGARLGLIGTFLALSFTVLAWAGPKWLRERDSVVAPVVVLAFPAGLLAVMVSSFVVPAIRVRVWGSGASGSAESTEARKIQFALGIPKLLKHPQGFGIGMAGQTIGFDPSGTGFLTVDSFYLTILMEYGFVGFVAFYAIFCLAIYYAVMAIIRYKMIDGELGLIKPLTISMLIFLATKSVFSQETNLPIFFMMLAMITVLCHRISLANQTSTPAAPSGPRVRQPRTAAKPTYAAKIPTPSIARPVGSIPVGSTGAAHR